MTPTNPAPSAPWWQTLLITIANIAIGALVNHYLGPVAAAGTLAVGTATAHAMKSPLDQK